MLERQLVPILLTQGVETKADPKAVMAGKLLVLENAVFDRPGRLQRRNGYAGIPQLLTETTTEIDPITMTEYGLMGMGQPFRTEEAETSGGRALGVLKDQLLVTDGILAYARSQAGWINKGVCEAIAVSSSPAIRNTYQQTTQDMAVHPSGLTVYTWEDSRGGSRYSVYDTATKQPIVNDVEIGTTASLPKPFAIGNYLVIVYYEASGADRICYLPIPVSNPTVPLAIVDAASDPVTSGSLLDACVAGGILGSLFVMYKTNANTVKVFPITASLVLGAATTVCSVAVRALGIWSDSAGNIWFIYHVTSTTTTFYQVYTNAMMLLCPETMIAIGTTVIVNLCGVMISDTNAVAFGEVNPPALGNSYERLRVAEITVTGVVISVENYVRSVGLASKPWFYNGRVHIMVTHDSTLQKTYFVLADGGAIVAKLAPGIGYGLTAKAILPEVCNPETGVYKTTYLRADRLITVDGTILTQCGVQEATFDFNTPQQAIELSDNLHLTGGILSVFDGVQTVESGFHLFPEDIAATPSASGGAILAGTYQYRVMWEWMDNFGCLHRSAPSIPVSVTTTGSTSSVALVIPTLRLTARNTPISVVIYRTLANQIIFLRITSITSPLLNSTTVDTVTFADTYVDTDIDGNEQLYTTGGELENIAPPAPGAIAKYKNRLVVVDAENPSSLWYSKEVIQGVPIEFNDALVKSIPQGTSDGITAMQQMDDKLILFDSERAYVQFGDGWAADGSGDNLTTPQALPTASGCTRSKSLSVIPTGLMFQSEKGIQLIDRGLNLQYIGAPVEAYNPDAVNAAQVIPSSRQARFALDSGVLLVYDYYVNQWGVFTNHAAVDAVIWQNQFTYLQSDGKVCQEAPAVYTDDGVFSPMRFRTSWLSFASLQGFERVRRLLILGEYRGAHRLTVEIAYDFNQNPTQFVTVDPGTLLDTPVYGDPDPYGTVSPYGGEFPLYQFRIHLTRQKAQAIQITVYDSQVPPYNEGLSVTALTLEVGVKKGTNKMRAVRSAG
jgi:hypothetical protein